MSESMSTANTKNGEVAVRVWYFNTKGKHTWVFPKNYLFKTTYEFIKSLNGQHYVTLTTAPTGKTPTTVRARITTLHPLDSIDNADKLKELTDCKPAKPTPAEKRAWGKWDRKMTKEWQKSQEAKAQDQPDARPDQA